MATSSTSATDEIISGTRGGTFADACAAQGQRQVDATWAGIVSQRSVCARRLISLKKMIKYISICYIFTYYWIIKTLYTNLFLNSIQLTLCVRILSLATVSLLTKHMCPWLSFCLNKHRRINRRTDRYTDTRRTDRLGASVGQSLNSKTPSILN